MGSDEGGMGVRHATPAVRSVCNGCGWEPPADEPYPFRCWHADARDDVDHLLARRVDLDAIAAAWGAIAPLAARGTTAPAGVREFWRAIFLSDEPNPFVRYRVLLHSYQAARARGTTDAQYVDLVRRLDAAVAQVDGAGFRVTPFAPAPGLAVAIRLPAPDSPEADAPAPAALAPDALWVKDETRHVSGSHKARHLMGLALWLAVTEGDPGRAESHRGEPQRGAPPALAIASCGNAALAAAVVARAIQRPLRVFIPTDAHPHVVERLRALGALLEICPRQPEIPGDPTLHAFRAAVQAGALPFCCQGNENGLTIEGGMTLGWELASQLAGAGVTLDRLFVQVGGGALASSVAQALDEAVRLGVLPRAPRLHAVQTQGGHPLKRAYDRVAARMAQQLEDHAAERDMLHDAASGASSDPDDAVSPLDAALSYATTHRAQFMWPWETPPHSAAHGILDDETYDWLAVVRAMLQTGGSPVVVDEATLLEAHTLACRTTGIPVDPTGASGLAGCLALARAGRFGAAERVAVLFTGVER